MAEQAGGSAAALSAAQDALAQRRGAAEDADRTLAAVLADAHHVVVEATRQLDLIEAEIESAVAHQHLLALDTPEGAREFQRFLLVKQRDIRAVVTDAAARSESKAADVQRLLDHYRTGSGAATGD